MNVVTKCDSTACLVALFQLSHHHIIISVYMHMFVGLLKPQSEGVAIEALQLCTLLLPPSSRRKLQLLMRMMSRISQNVDMPRLHPAIGTRTLVRHSTHHLGTISTLPSCIYF